MKPMLLEAASIIAVAVAVLLAVTTLALRRSEARRTTARRRSTAGASIAGGMLAVLPTWGGVLVTVLLLTRGKVALAGIAALATVVHAGIMRLRAARDARVAGT